MNDGLHAIVSLLAGFAMGAICGLAIMVSLIAGGLLTLVFFMWVDGAFRR